jgi:hypothetical protein
LAQPFELFQIAPDSRLTDPGAFGQIGQRGKPQLLNQIQNLLTSLIEQHGTRPAKLAIWEVCNVSMRGGPIKINQKMAVFFIELQRAVGTDRFF